MTDVIWTKALKAELERRWATDEPAASIGLAFGCSKDAVIGKAHRMKLPARPNPMHKKGSGTPRDIPRPVPVADTPRLAPFSSLACEALPKSPLAREVFTGPVWDEPVRPMAEVVELPARTTCCFPSGTPRTSSFSFCNARAMPGSPYCATHRRICYLPPRRGVA